MSNFCSITYYFEGDKQCLRDFYKKMEIIGHKTTKDYQERQRMVELANAFDLKPSDYYIRGFFYNLHIANDNSSMLFDVISDNVPCQKLINAIIKHYEDKISVLWFVECPDEGEYFTIDSEKRIFKYRYEVYLEDIDSEWFETIPKAVEWIRRKTSIVIPESI